MASGSRGIGEPGNSKLRRRELGDSRLRQMELGSCRPGPRQLSVAPDCETYLGGSGLGWRELGGSRLRLRALALQAEMAGVSRLGLKELSFAPSCETEFGGPGWNRGSSAAQGSDGGSLAALG